MAQASGKNTVQEHLAPTAHTWIVVTRVHRPCLMMSVQGMTLEDLAVKGEAIEASPVTDGLGLDVVCMRKTVLLL